MTPLSDNADKATTAAWMGYGEDIAGMDREHDFWHRSLAKWLGMPSYSMRVAANADAIRKVLLLSDLGLSARFKGVDLDLVALGRQVCNNLRDAIGSDEFNRIVRPLIVSNGISNAV